MASKEARFDIINFSAGKRVKVVRRSTLYFFKLRDHIFLNTLITQFENLYKKLTYLRQKTTNLVDILTFSSYNLSYERQRKK